MNEFRRRIALWFVSLSLIVYFSLSFIGVVVFHEKLSSSLDAQLNVMLSEYGHAIDLDGTTPHFRDWIRTVQTDPKKGLATIELFDVNKRLLEHFGPKGIVEFCGDKKELNESGLRMRLSNTPLNFRGRPVGYMQVELPTRDRDEDIWSLLCTMALMSPFILIGLGVASYLVAGKAAAPLQEALDKMKSFVADAGHELNTPLAITRARLETLERKHKRQQIDTADLDLALKSMTRMEKIVEDLMLLAELDGYSVVPDQKEIDLRELVSNLVEEVAPRFSDKGVKLQEEILSSAFISAEASSFYRAVANLVENALRYTEPGGTVKLELSAVDGFAQIAICDTGIGISDENLNKIFDRFFRSDKSRSRYAKPIGIVRQHCMQP